VAHLAGALGLAFAIGAKVVATQRGPHWELSAEETSQLGGAWAVVLAPYLTGMGAAAPWVSAVIVTGGIVVPRILADGTAAKALPADASEPDPKPVSPPPGTPDVAAVPTGGYEIKPPKVKR